MAKKKKLPRHAGNQVRPGFVDPDQGISPVCVSELLLSHEGKHAKVSAGIGHQWTLFSGY